MLHELSSVSFIRATGIRWGFFSLAERTQTFRGVLAVHYRTFYAGSCMLCSNSQLYNIISKLRLFSPQFRLPLCPVLTRFVNDSPINRSNEVSKQNINAATSGTHDSFHFRIGPRKLLRLLKESAEQQGNINLLALLESVRVADLLGQANDLEVALLVFNLGKLTRIVKDTAFMREFWSLWFPACNKACMKWTAQELNMALLGLANLQPKIPSYVFCNLCDTMVGHFKREFHAQHVANGARSINVIFQKNCVDIADMRCDEAAGKVLRTCHEVSLGRLNQFTAQGLCTLIYALLASVITEQWMLQWLTTANDKASRFIAQGFANSVYKLGKIAEERPALFGDRAVHNALIGFLQLFSNDLNSKGEQFGEQGLSNIAIGLDKLRSALQLEQMSGLWHQLIMLSCGQLHYFTEQGFCNFFYALAPSAITEEWLLKWLKVANEKFSEFSAQGLANSVFKLGVLSSQKKSLFLNREICSRTKNLLRLLNKQFASKSELFTQQGISNIAMGLENLYLVLEPALAFDLWSRLDALFIRRIAEFTPQGLTNFANARAKYDYSFDHQNLMFPGSAFVCSLKSACYAKMDAFSQHSISEVLNVFTLWRLRDDLFLTRWLTLVDVAHCGIDTGAVVLRNLAKLGIPAPSTLWTSVVTDLQKASDQELIMVMYGVCNYFVQGELKEPFLSQVQAAVKSELDRRKFNARDAENEQKGVLQMYRFLFGHDCLPKSVVQAMDASEWLSQLEKYNNRNRKEALGSVGEAIAILLKRRKLAHKWHVETEKFIPEVGCHVDNYISRGGDTGIVVQADGVTHYYITAEGKPLCDASGLTSQTKMNTYLLERRGHKVIRVPFYVFKEGKNALDAFLNKQLERHL